jgi:hypothetical protein
MMGSRQRTRIIAIILLLPSLVAVLPSVQWCALYWDQVSAATYLTCLTHGATATRCTLARTTACTPSCARPLSPAAAGGCPFAETAVSTGTASRACCQGSKRAAITLPTSAPSPPRGSRSGRARAYCLADPASGRAIQFRALPLDDPSVPVAIVAATVLPEPPATPMQAVRPDAAAQSPTRVATTLPPVRAPPDQG